MLRKLEKKIAKNSKQDYTVAIAKVYCYTDCKAMLESVIEKIETSKGNILTNDDFDEGLEYAIKLLKGE